MKEDDAGGDLVLPVEVLYGLDRAGIKTCGQLRAASDDELLDLRGVAAKTLTSIHQAVRHMKQWPDDDLLADHHPITRRNKKIISRAKDESLHEIAGSYGISVDRVRQIVSADAGVYR
jgi:Bacterial RNA polymerase, alpha chain C terminal domain